VLAKISILIQIEIKSQNLRNSQSEASVVQIPLTHTIEGMNRCQWVRLPSNQIELFAHLLFKI